MSQHSEYEELQSLLLGNNKQLLQALKARIENPERRTRDVAEVLSAALHLAAQDKALRTALREPMQDAIRDSIRRNPHEIADLLYPVIFPAIRQSIEETLRAFVERIDTLIQQRFSVHALKWRVEAWRTGLPYTEVMLRHSIKYGVEHLLLIQNQSGLLLKHVHSKDALKTDSDAVSAMLTAIESFVRDSFSNTDKERLDRITFGQFMIHLAHGPHATLASVVRGLAPPDYLMRLKELLEDIHAAAAIQLRDFNGDTRQLDAIEPLLQRGFEREYVKPKAKHAASRPPRSLIKRGAMVAGVLLIGIVALSTYRHFEQQGIAALGQRLDAVPGVVVENITHRGDHWVVTGLRDPYAATPEQLLESAGKVGKKITFNLHPYVSLDPEIIFKKALPDLEIPAGLKIATESGMLQLSGQVPLDWYLRLRHTLNETQGSPLLDIRNLQIDLPSAERSIQNLLAGSNVLVTRNADALLVTGNLTPDDATRLQALIGQLSGKLSIELQKTAVTP